ncbi:MAG TPA: S-layer homology domain-containing protein [Vicinamibacteria bacterium]|nr:S-layer homology domain-containing protein [Vicinamibacteria bacterium]
MPLSAAHTIDNANNVYFLDVQMVGPVTTTRFTSVRVFYQLQVSPAPATATFPNDVPTGHPFFRFVEALAAAGITGGCSSGSYCPNSPVTRGEMAVFLATALGLHFPN